MPLTVVQPDGTQLTVRLQGDEHKHWYATTDGAIIVNQDNAYYIAAIEDDGTVTATTLLAHDAADRTEAETAAIDAQNTAALHDAATSARAKASTLGSPSVAYFPHTGAPRALVLLVQFTDSVFSLQDPVASFTELLNAEDTPTDVVEGLRNESRNYKGVRGYFKDMSFGQFTPQFDVKGVYTLPNPIEYYGNGTVYSARMLRAAVEAADDDVDFSDYDSDGDGYVDLIYLIHASYGSNITGNSSSLPWANVSVLAPSLSVDGVKVYRYGVNCELDGKASSNTRIITGIGVFVHEFSHTLGLPDLYYNSTVAADNNDMQYWDLMDCGEYSGSGFRPTAYTAWEREVMGWMDITPLSEQQYVSDWKTIDEGGAAYKIERDDTDEYVVLQNIQKEGWNARIPVSSAETHGMLAYRVNYPYTYVNMNDNPNSTLGSPSIVVLAADGVLSAFWSTMSDAEYVAELEGDTYPGSTGTTQVDSWPMQDGSSLVKPVYDIEEDTSTGTMSFSYLSPKSVTAVAAVSEAQCVDDTRIFTLDGRYVGTDINVLPSGIYVSGGRKVVK